MSAAPTPPKKRGGFLRGCLIAIGVLIVLGVIGQALGGGNNAANTAAPTVAPTTAVAAVADVPTEAPAAAEPTEAPAAAPTVAPTPEPEPTEAPAAAFTVGQDVAVGEVRWKVLEATDEGTDLKADNEFVEPKTTAGKWVRVRFEIENLSTDQLNFTGVDVTDGQGRTFNPSTEVFMHVPTEEMCSLAQLNANVPKTCQVVFEVPADASGFKMKVGDLKLFGADEAVIDLGL